MVYPEITRTIIADNVSFARFPTASTCYSLDKMADCRFARGIGFYVNSNLNQPITIQAVVGLENNSHETNRLVGVGQVVNVPALGRVALSANLNDFTHPYFSIMVETSATAPTAGNLDIVASVEPLLWPQSSPEIDPSILALQESLTRLAQSQAALQQSIDQLIQASGSSPSGRDGLLWPLFGARQ